MERYLKRLLKACRKKWIRERIETQDNYFSTVIAKDEENSELMSIIKKELQGLKNV